ATLAGFDERADAAGLGQRLEVDQALVMTDVDDPRLALPAHQCTTGGLLPPSLGSSASCCGPSSSTSPSTAGSLGASSASRSRSTGTTSSREASPRSSSSSSSQPITT